MMAESGVERNAAECKNIIHYVISIPIYPLIM